MKNFQELPKLSDSISYLYIEHAVIEQEDASVVAICKDGRIQIPIATVTCLMLGPGTSVTHAAIRAICDNGCMAIWCGENGGRFYASGSGETRSSKQLLAQARCCMDEKLHMEVVRKMYALRFPHMNTDGFTLQQIRGMEGIRVRKVYEQMSKSTGVKWRKRTYKTECWDASDPINQTLSEANAMLYGLCNAAIVTLGYSPGLGFIHTGKQLSFVYDVADLYKTETTIPAAFEAVKNGGDIHKNLRLLCRRYFSNSRILSRVSEDLVNIFSETLKEDQDNYDRVGDLWEPGGTVSGGKNYG